jgi:hypothetical protein
MLSTNEVEKSKTNQKKFKTFIAQVGKTSCIERQKLDRLEKCGGRKKESTMGCDFDVE